MIVLSNQSRTFFYNIKDVRREDTYANFISNFEYKIKLIMA